MKNNKGYSVLILLDTCAFPFIDLKKEEKTRDCYYTTRLNIKEFLSKERYEERYSITDSFKETRRGFLYDLDDKRYYLNELKKLDNIPLEELKKKSWVLYRAWEFYRESNTVMILAKYCPNNILDRPDLEEIKNLSPLLSKNIFLEILCDYSNLFIRGEFGECLNLLKKKREKKFHEISLEPKDIFREKLPLSDIFHKILVREKDFYEQRMLIANEKEMYLKSLKVDINFVSTAFALGEETGKKVIVISSDRDIEELVLLGNYLKEKEGSPLRVNSLNIIESNLQNIRIHE